MNFFKGITTRWPGDELKKWSSVRKTVYILLPMLIYYVVHDLTEILLWGITELVVSRQNNTIIQFVETNSNTLQGMINGLSVLLGMIAIWEAVRREITYVAAASEQQGTEIQTQSNQKTIHKKDVDEKTVTDYVLLGILALSGAIGLNILFSLLGLTGQSEIFNQVVIKQYGVNFLIGLILYGIISPFAEEAVFRGVIYNRLKRCFGCPIGLIISALLFGCYHGNLVQGIYGFLLGLLIAYTYEKYKTFIAPVFFHSIANVSIFALTYGNRLSNMSRNTGILAGAAAMITAGISLCLMVRRFRGSISANR